MCDKIDWRRALEKKGVDPEKFKEEFRAALVHVDLIDDLLQLAAFQMVYHDIRDGCKKMKSTDTHGECSECYSGDTEFEMREGVINLKNPWKIAMSKMSVAENDDATEDDDEDDDDNVEIVNFKGFSQLFKN